MIYLFNWIVGSFHGLPVAELPLLEWGENL